MSGKTRILIVTDSPVLPSGLAETTRLIFGGLLDRYPEAYELHQVGLFHCYAVTKPRWPVYPTEAGRTADGQVCFAPDDRYGQKTFPKIAGRLRPDLVFGFGEPHRLLHLCQPRSQRPWRLVLPSTTTNAPSARNASRSLPSYRICTCRQPVPGANTNSYLISAPPAADRPFTRRSMPSYNPRYTTASHDGTFSRHSAGSPLW